MTTKNEVLLEGLALGEPEWSHENHGAQFYRLYLQVPRLSGQVDLLPVLLPLFFPRLLGVTAAFWLFIGFAGGAWVNSFYLNRIFSEKK